jgi:2-phospho-L-lactate guanylyltransferase
VPTVVVVPVRSFVVGKRRLEGVLTDGARSNLGRAMATRVGEVVESTGLLPLFVTADPDVAEWATKSGFPSVADPGEGLNGAARAGVDWVTRSHSRWIVLHSDLPLLTPEDLSSLAAWVHEDLDVIAPSADGGTSALSSRKRITFAYGPGSFRSHLVQMANPRIAALTGFLHDLDSPLDLASAQQHPRGEWLLGVLS